MPNINLANERQRDAVVKAESVRIPEIVRFIGPKGGAAWTRKVLKATVDHDYEALLAKFKTPEAIAEALLQGDPEVDIERFGQYLWNTSKVYINKDEEIVFHVEQNEIVRGPKGRLKEKRPRQQPEANVDTDVPLSWTGKKIDKQTAIRQFVLTSKLQIIHINGLTYDFLFAMAKELADENVLMLLGAGDKGNSPLIFRRGSVPYRGFLEGRVDGEKYILLLHLSNMELQLPGSKKKAKPAEAISVDDENADSDKNAAAKKPSEDS